MEIMNKKFNNWLDKSKTNVDVFNNSVKFFLLGVTIGVIITTLILL